MPSPAPGRGPRLRAVIWDYDGTLVDTRSTDEESVRRLVAAEPTLASGVAAFWATEGMPIDERLEEAWPGRGVALLRAFELDDMPAVHAGIRDVLVGLRSRRLLLAVVSSRREAPLRRGLRATGLDAYTGAVVIGLESVSAAKPDPEGLLLAVSRLEVEPAEAAYVGDRLGDMEAARAAGMAGWMATWGHAEPMHVPPGARAMASPGDVLRAVADG